MDNVHISVLQEEVLALFRGKELSIFIDATLGAAGHASAICAEHSEIQQFIGFDRDPSALEIAASRLPSITLVHSNYSALKEKLLFLGIREVDGILFDLGVSSMQLDREERGFSFMSDGPLDMRMDTTQRYTAEDIVNSLPEFELARIIYEYGEDRASRRIAKAIVQKRRKSRIQSTKELADIVCTVVPRHGRLHPATRVFQALRMAVNEELESITSAIEQAINLLAPNGTLAIISFHSLEDRLVKNAFKGLDKEQFFTLTKKPIEASLDEVRKNLRSRSAKLRAITRLK